MTPARTAGCLGVAFLLAAPALPAQEPAAAAPPSGTIEHIVPPGPNYHKAVFRLWVPEGMGRLRGTIVLVPGSNGDGRNMVADSVWQSFAARHRFGLVGCQFTDKPHEQGFLEDYVNVAQGS